MLDTQSPFSKMKSEDEKDAIRLYEMQEMALSDYMSGINAAVSRTTVEIAKRMLKRGEPIEYVAEVTELDEFTVKKLLDEL